MTASYTDGSGTAESVSSSATALVTNVNDAPTGAVTVSGTASQGQTLTAGNTLADADGLGTISYQWKANGSPISGATSSSLTLTQAEVGKTISVTASYTDGSGTAESVSSNATAVVANVNDAPILASPLPDAAATEGARLSIAVPPGTFTDIDSSNLLYSASQASGLALPTWLVFDASSGVFSGVPGSGDIGALTVRLTASDGALSASDEFTITVTGLPRAISGLVQDGYVAGASIFVDRNGNGLPDAAEDTGLRTDASGNFSGTIVGNGALIAVGGTNIDTGLRNTLTLTAPQGATVISPITTLVQTLVSGQSLSVEQAQNKVAQAFGVAGVDLLKFDPLKAADTAQGLAVQKVNAQLALTAALVADPGAAVSGLARVVSQASTPVDLSNAATLAQATSGLSLSASQQATIAQGNAQVQSSTSLSGVAQAQQTTVAAALPPNTDWLAPRITASNPAEGATGATLSGNLVFAFSEAIQPGSGAISLRTADGKLVQRFESGSAAITVQGSTLTLDPSADLAPSTGYAVVFEPGAVKDLAGNSHPGAAQTFSSVTVPGDVTAPLATRFIPADSAKLVPISSNLSITFNELIQPGTGAIRLKTADGKTVETFTAANATVSGSTLTLNPTADLSVFTKYVLELDAGAVRDMAGNSSPASSSYDFQTASVDGLYHMFVVAFAAAPGLTYMGQLAEAWNHFNGLPPRASDGAGALQQIVEIFTTKPQFTSVYPTTMSNRELATVLVNNIVKTSATEASRTEAINDIEAVLSPEIGWSRGKMLFTVFGNLASKPLNDPTWGGTAKQFQNQLAVARYFTEEMGVATETLSTLGGVIGNVTPDTDVSTIERIVQIIGSPPPGG